RYEALPGDIDHLFLPETLRNSNLSATIIDEFLPRAAVVAADPGERNRAGPLVQASVPVQLTVERDLGSRLDLVVLAPDRSLLRFGRWAFPGWQATVNGQRVALQPDRNGLVSLWVPQGENRLSLRLEPPRVRRVALAVSCVSLLVWVGLAVIGGMVGRGHRPGAAR
ncbi:MAG: hypothetical protein OEV91_08435, partial [Desulfobulbaceae bacterium]|nr:hypothetical protein [Desulfobulbaceae bacterium]